MRLTPAIVVKSPDIPLREGLVPACVTEITLNTRNASYKMPSPTFAQCDGILDICMRLNLVDENINLKSRSLLLRIVSMLTQMTRPLFGNAGGQANVHVNERASATIKN